MGRKGRQVFIGGLSPETNAEDLRRLFADIGGITYATVWKDSETGQLRGAGKVEFDTAELAQRAVEALRAPAAGSISFATVFFDGDTGQMYLQYDKAIDWLMSRRKLQEDWHTVLIGINAKASLAVKDALSDKASMDVDLDYFKIKDFYDLLEKSGDSKEKKALKAVLDLYKSSNTHMVEAANSLVQMVRYDIPAAINQAQSFEKQSKDVERRQRDLSKREAEDKRKLKEMCNAHQISGDNFDAELKAHISKALPRCLEDVASKIKSSCPKPLLFYGAFSKSLSQVDEGANEKLMPLLHFIVDHGDAPLTDAGNLSKELKAECQKAPKGVKVLANTFARGLAVDELVELQAFLAERCWELEEIEKGSLQQNANVKLQHNLEETKAFHTNITEVVDSLCGREVQPLLLLSSESKQRRVVSELTVQKALCEKPAKESATLEERKAELSAEADFNLKDKQSLQAQVRQLKGWLEEEMTRLMKYKVCLVGEVNGI